MSCSWHSCLLLTHFLEHSFRFPAGPEHWNTPSFQQFSPPKLKATIFTSSLKATSPVKYLHGAGMVLIRQGILASMQSREETSHSKVQWEDQESYFIYQVYPRKAYVKAKEELDSLSSWEAHCNVSGRSFPQDVWNRWFNHIKFLVLPTWLKTCPLFLQQQQVPFTIPRNSTCTTHHCSQGSGLTGQPFSFTLLQSSPQQLCLPSHGTQSLCFPLWPSCTSAWVRSHLGRTGQTQHTTGALSDCHVLLQRTIHSSRGILLTGRSDHPFQGLLQKPAISIRRE